MFTYLWNNNELLTCLSGSTVPCHRAYVRIGWCVLCSSQSHVAHGSLSATVGLAGVAVGWLGESQVRLCQFVPAAQVAGWCCYY